ncbi:hypothetical protein JOQ06_022211, partial [Pogonophryne albipinna]
MSRLSTCKRQQLQSQGRSFLTDADVSNHLTKDELALHCRRRTRGEGTTTQLLEELLLLGLIGNGGNDSLGVHLFDRERMEHILRVQRKRIMCIQDMPGTSANSVNVHIYLLEGLHRWNQDRGTAALATQGTCEKLFGRKMVPEFCPPSRYTGELIGMQYLLQQTGQALQDMHPDSEEIAQLIEEHEDVMEEDEGFSDIRDDPTVLDLGVLHTAP